MCRVGGSPGAVRRKLSEDLDPEDPEGHAVERRLVVTYAANFHHECVKRSLDAVFVSRAERVMRGLEDG